MHNTNVLIVLLVVVVLVCRCCRPPARVKHDTNIHHRNDTRLASDGARSGEAAAGGPKIGTPQLPQDGASLLATAPQ